VLLRGFSAVLGDAVFSFCRAGAGSCCRTSATPFLTARAPGSIASAAKVAAA